MYSILKERNIQPEKVQILTAALVMTGANHLIAIIFAMVVWKEGPGTKEECCGT